MNSKTYFIFVLMSNFCYKFWLISSLLRGANKCPMGYKVQWAIELSGIQSSVSFYEEVQKGITN